MEHQMTRFVFRRTKMRMQFLSRAGPCLRGLCIAMEQYSSFCGCAVDLAFGGFDHMENDDQDSDKVSNSLTEYFVFFGLLGPFTDWSKRDVSLGCTVNAMQRMLIHC